MHVDVDRIVLEKVTMSQETFTITISDMEYKFDGKSITPLCEFPYGR